MNTVEPFTFVSIECGRNIYSFYTGINKYLHYLDYSNCI